MHVRISGFVSFSGATKRLTEQVPSLLLLLLVLSSPSLSPMAVMDVQTPGEEDSSLSVTTGSSACCNNLAVRENPEVLFLCWPVYCWSLNVSLSFFKTSGVHNKQLLSCEAHRTKWSEHIIWKEGRHQLFILFYSHTAAIVASLALFISPQPLLTDPVNLPF